MSEEIRLSHKELPRVKVLQNVLDQRITQVEAGKLLKLTARHVNRIIVLARKIGLYKALSHKSRGRTPNNKISDSAKNNILSICKEKYYDFGPKFATEKLQENHSIDISKETLRTIFIKNNVPYPKRKNNSGTCHIWRQRRPHFGEMIQIDGSHHRWLEDRLDQEFCLMIYVDDATGELYARFYEYEGLFPAMDSLMRFVKIYGIPKSIYSDKHSTYITTREPSVDELLKAQKAKTQFIKVLDTLNIEHIAAHSPQAKGRVERAAETLQDRLVKELRLNNICSISNANDFLDKIYLKKFNSQFAKQPAHQTPMFNPLPHNFDFKWTFAISDIRTVGNDFTLSWNNRLFLLLNRSLSIKRKKVLIKQSLEGDLQFSTKDKIISVREITQNDLSAAKRNATLLNKIAKEYCYKKSKKSWMDRYYIATNRSFFA